MERFRRSTPIVVSSVRFRTVLSEALRTSKRTSRTPRRPTRGSVMSTSARRRPTSPVLRFWSNPVLRFSCAGVSGAPQAALSPGLAIRLDVRRYPVMVDPTITARRPLSPSCVGGSGRDSVLPLGRRTQRKQVGQSRQLRSKRWTNLLGKRNWRTSARKSKLSIKHLSTLRCGNEDGAPGRHDPAIV